MRFSLSALLCVLSLLPIADLASPARADSKAYCTAYARDLANRKVLLKASTETTLVNPAGDGLTTTASLSQPTGDEQKMESRWRGVYRSALQGCVEQYSNEQPKPILVVPKIVAPPKPVAAVNNPVAAVKKPAKQTSAPTDGIKRGSDEWKRKCLAAHPSFSADTGTYRTWSGAQRECQ